MGSVRRRRPRLALGQLVFMDKDSSASNNISTVNGAGGEAAQHLNARVVTAHARQRTAPPPTSAASHNVGVVLGESSAEPYWTPRTSESLGLHESILVTGKHSVSKLTGPGSLQLKAYIETFGSQQDSLSLPDGSPLNRRGRALNAAAAAVAAAQNGAAQAAFSLPSTVMLNLVVDAARAAEEAVDKCTIGTWESQPSTMVKFNHPPTLVAVKGSTGSHADDCNSTSGLSHSLSLLRRVTAARDTAAQAMEAVLPASAWASSFPNLEPESCLEDSYSCCDPEGPALRYSTSAPSFAVSAAPSFVPSSLSAAGWPAGAGVRTPLDELAAGAAAAAAHLLAVACAWPATVVAATLTDQARLARQFIPAQRLQADLVSTSEGPAQLGQFYLDLPDLLLRLALPALCALPLLPGELGWQEIVQSTWTLAELQASQVGCPTSVSTRLLVICRWLNPPACHGLPIQLTRTQQPHCLTDLCWQES
jgi:hypothetical protein